MVTCLSLPPSIMMAFLSLPPSIMLTFLSLPPSIMAMVIKYPFLVYAIWAVLYVLKPVFVVIDQVKKVARGAFRCVRCGVWFVYRVPHWLYDGLSSEEKSARRARVRVMALVVVSATVWLGVYTSLRVGLADEQVCQ